MSVIRPVLACGLMLLMVAATAACREDGVWIDSVKFEGTDQIDKNALANALVTRKGSWLPWAPKRYFDRRAFEVDQQRIVAFYRDRGFPDARVVSVDPALNDKQDRIDITIQISEGQPIRVAAIVLEGFEVLPEPEQRRLAEELPLKPDRPLDLQLVTTSREAALNALRNNGYPYAQVRLLNEPVGEKRERVVLRAVPGTLATFGPVEVTGQAKVDDRIIARQLTFKRGDAFSRDEMRESQRSLYRMELFQFVNVESIEDLVAMPPEVPVRVTVAEGKHRKISFGGGYGTEEHLRARVRWDHLNFLGGARHAGVEARWSSLDRGVRSELRQPNFLHQTLSLGFEGQWWHVDEPAYAQNTLGGRIVLRRQRSPVQFTSVSVIHEYEDSTVDEEALADPTVRDELIALGLDPRTGGTEGTVSALAVDFGRNTTTTPLDARRGYVVAAHLEYAGEWLWGTYRYWSAKFDARHFQPIGRRVVVANRLAVGSIEPADGLDENVPFHKRYFLGGAGSNRGWGRFEISPLSEGQPIGGLTTLDGSAEARVQVWGKLGSVAFLDYSQVWLDAWTFTAGGLQYAAGAGARYLTPIGPARFDVGYQLNPIEGLLIDGEPQTRRWRVHFSIGQAF